MMLFFCVWFKLKLLLPFNCCSSVSGILHNSSHRSFTIFFLSNKVKNQKKRCHALKTSDDYSCLCSTSCGAITFSFLQTSENCFPSSLRLLHFCLHAINRQNSLQTKTCFCPSFWICKLTVETLFQTLIYTPYFLKGICKYYIRLESEMRLVI